MELATERISGDEPEEIAVLHGLAVILLQQGELERARQLLARCLDYWRRRGDDSKTAMELNSLAIAYRYIGDEDQARALFTEGISLAERSGDTSRLAALFSNLGILEIDVGAPATAIDLFNKAILLDRELKDRWAEACDRVNRAAGRISAGQIDAARQDLRDVSSDALAVDDVDLTIGLIELLAMLWGNPATSAEARGFSAPRRRCGSRPTCPGHRPTLSI